MNFPKYIPFLFLICISVLYGCEKEEKPYVPVQLCADLSRNMDTINQYIHGTWDWIEEKRYNRIKGEYEYFTPKDYGYNLTRIFSGDTLKFFNNTTLDSVYQFKIQKEFEITNFPSDTLSVIAYYSFHTGLSRGYVPIIICKTQLLMLHDINSDVIGRRLWVKR